MEDFYKPWCLQITVLGMPNKQLLIGVIQKKSVLPDQRNTSESLSIGYHQNVITIIGLPEDVDGILKERRKKLRKF